MSLSSSKRRRRLRRRLPGWVLPAVGVALAFSGLVTATRFSAARQDAALARSSLQSAREAVAGGDVPAARTALDEADRLLVSLARRASALPLRLLRPIPVFGSPVRALVAGSSAGREAVAAGRILADAAGVLPTSGTATLDGHDLSALHQAAAKSGAYLARAERHLTAARRLLAGPSGAWLPPVSAFAKALRDELDQAGAQLRTAERGLRLMGQLTAPETDARLLLLSQDTMELRPTGGYIGSFGVLRVSHGTAALERYDSFEELPDPEPAMEAPAELAAVQTRPWDLSNANWWPDFPTSARTAKEMLRRQGGGEVDGVVAITEAVMARLTGVLGPIEVPGYQKAVTEEGFAERVLYEVELKRPLDTPRKKFLTLLADEVFGRLFSVPAERFPAVVDALGRSAGAGELQVWFENPAWQGEVAGTSLDGSLPKVKGDFLLLAEANLTAGKANGGVVRDLQYTVRPDRGGRLRAELRLAYRNDAQASEINPYYNGFVRVYVPEGSELVGDEGYPLDAPDGAFSVLAGEVYVEPGGGEKVLTFEYLLPKRLPSGGSYQLTWLHQPGTPRDTYTAVIDGRAFVAEPGVRRFTVETELRERGLLARLLPG